MQIIVTFYQLKSNKQYQQMSNENKPRQMRIFSAKVTPSRTERSRPASGATTINLKKQMIENLYGGVPVHTLPSRQNSSKIIVFQGTAKTQQNQKSVKRVSKHHKQKQDLIEENLQLKRTINKLVEELSHQKGKTEAVKKHSSKMSKVLMMEHEKQIYWGTNTVGNHLITGVKNMYEALKQKYEQKCAQYDKLVKRSSYTKELQFLTYIDILQNENKSLNSKLQRLSHGSIQIITNNQTQKQASEYILAELESEKQVIINKYKELDAKWKMSKEGLNDRNKKISFLQKLIIEKDNNQHAMKKKLKKVEFDLSLTNEKLIQKSHQYDELELKHSEFQQNAKLNEEQKLKKLSIQIELMIKEKDQRINLLEKENRYLENMIKDLRATNTSLNKQFQQNKEKEGGMNTVQKLIVTSVESENQLPHKPVESNQVKSVKNQEKKKFIPYNSLGKRIPRTADQKNSQNSQKKRKVDARQVEDIGQFLKFRFIGLSLPIESVKQFFHFHSSQKLTHQQIQWQKQYICMKQILQTFKTTTFNLDEQDAMTLARYLIQQATGEYIYCDMENQNKRSIVKSIFKHVVGDYEVFTQQDWKAYYQFFEKYKSNIKSMLKSNLGTGVIVSKKKLVDLMEHHGIDPSESIKSQLIGKLAQKSKKITELDCSILIH